MARTVILLALALSGLALACGQGDEGVSLVDDVGAAPIHWELDDVRTFGDYEVYYLGDSYQGLPLVEVLRIDYDGTFPDNPELNRPDHRIVFIYGDCEIQEGEDRCPVPLTLNVRPENELPVDKVMGKQGPPECVRGALVQRLKSGAVEIWTGDAQVELVPVGDVNLEPAVSSLMRANGGKPDVPSQPFPPPKGGECN